MRFLPSMEGSHAWAGSQLSILSMRFEVGYTSRVYQSRTRLSILSMRFCLRMQSACWRWCCCFQFSLWDSCGSRNVTTITFYNFQFSLWDSQAPPRVCPAPRVALSILSMRFKTKNKNFESRSSFWLSILSMRFAIGNEWAKRRWALSFQFSLWDSLMHGFPMTCIASITFNSLYEIQSSWIPTLQ